MAALYHRAHCVTLLKSLHVESPFSILRRMPGMTTLTTKAGNSKKPVRRTSIKKAKPKTIIDIGNLLLQKADKAKESRQFGFGDVALKAETETASNSKAVNVPDPAISKTVADKKPLTKSAPDCSVISTAKVNECVENSFETSKRVNKDETVPSVPSVTRDRLSTTASAPLQPSPYVSTSLSVSLEEITESTRVLGETTSTHHTIPEPGPALAPKTYSNIRSIIGRVKVPDLSNAVNVCTLVFEETERTDGPKDATSTRAVSISEINDRMPMQENDSYGQDTCTYTMHDPLTTSEVKHFQTHGVSPDVSATEEITYVTSSTDQDSGSLQPPVTTETSPDSTLTTCSSQNFTETQLENSSAATAYRLPFTDPKVSLAGPSKHSANQEIAPVEGAVFSSQPNIIDALRLKGPDVTLETVSESHTIWSDKCLMRSDPAYTELTDGIRAEGEQNVQEISDVRLDPIQKLFLDKIHEFTAKSKACDGLLDAGPEYEKAFSEELTKLQRLYGNGDLSLFPEFKFSEPVFDEMDE